MMSDKEYLELVERLAKKDTFNGKTKWNGNVHLRDKYMHIIQRCYNPNDKAYKDYGGRGIKMCDEWSNNRYKFIYWALSNGYDNSAKQGDNDLDRTDNNGDYSPTNCRFVSHKENCDNRRSPLPYKSNIVSAWKAIAEAGSLPSWVLEYGKEMNENFWRRLRKLPNDEYTFVIMPKNVEMKDNWIEIDNSMLKRVGR